MERAVEWGGLISLRERVDFQGRAGSMRRLMLGDGGPAFGGAFRRFFGDFPLLFGRGAVAEGLRLYGVVNWAVTRWRSWSPVMRWAASWGQAATQRGSGEERSPSASQRSQAAAFWAWPVEAEREWEDWLGIMKMLP